MHIAATAWLNFSGGLSLDAIFFRALMSPTGFRVSSTPLTSASDSRWRERAICMIGPTRKAMTVKMAPIANTTSIARASRLRKRSAPFQYMLAMSAANPIMVVTTSSSRTS